MTNHELVAEVTEFEPEPPLQPGGFRIRRHTLGNPLRAKLSEKKGQVSKFSDRYPTLIVVSAGFDNSAYLDSISFDSALYGEVAVTVQVPHDLRNPVRFDDGTHNAGRRIFGPKHNTSVSAVAALDGRPQMLRIYHNRHARTQLDAARTIVGTTNVRHFVKPDGGATGWEEVFGNPRGGVGPGAA